MPTNVPNFIVVGSGAGGMTAALTGSVLGLKVKLLEKSEVNARLLKPNGRPISGLYACGNDMDSMMAGIYPGPGINIGPAMTFGYIAAKHIASRIT